MENLVFYDSTRKSEIVNKVIMATKQKNFFAKFGPFSRFLEYMHVFIFIFKRFIDILDNSNHGKILKKCLKKDFKTRTLVVKG